MIVVADSSPLRYLILIEHTHVLAALYGRVLIPPAVSGELNRQRTRHWFALGWLEDRRGWKSALPNVPSPNNPETPRKVESIRSPLTDRWNWPP